MRAETQEVRKIVEEIQEIESDISELEGRKMRAEYRLEALVVSRNTPAVSVTAKLGPAHMKRPSNETSAKSLIVRHLNNNPSTDFSADMVARDLSMSLGTVRTNLSRLVNPKSRAIEKRSANTYGAIAPQSLQVVKDQEAPLLEEAS